MTDPLVSCICLTRNRREWLPKAIDCFEQQTYSQRELVIVWDGEPVADLVPSADNIRLVEYQQKDYKIGQKRNFANGHASGEIIAHWDDDDWSAPTRIEDQVKRLVESDKSVFGYHIVEFEGATEGRWAYRGSTSFAVGTSLCYRKDWWEAHKFSERQVGEDSDFAREAQYKFQLSTSDGSGMILASIHPGNTSKRNLNGHPWVKL